MANVPDRLARQVVDAFFEFHRAKPWERFSDAEPVLIRMLDLDEVWVAVVLGAAGEEFGLGLYKGENALGSLARLLRSDVNHEEFADSVTLLGATASRLCDIPAQARTVLTRARFTGRREALAPSFTHHAPGRRVREPRNAELRILALALKAFLEAERIGLARRELLLEGDIAVITATGPLGSPHVEVTLEPVPDDTLEEIVKEIPSLDLEGIPRRDDRLVVGLVRVSMEITGDDREPRALLVIDAEGGKIVQSTVVLDTSVANVAGELIRAMRSRSPIRPAGVPRSIVFGTRGLYLALSGALEDAGVECLLDPDDPALDAARSGLTDFIARGARTDAEAYEAATLAEWKDADRAVSRRLAAAVRRQSINGIVEEFFGGLEDGRAVLARHAETGAFDAMLEWAFVHYRPRDDAPTVAERVLALPGAPLDHTLIRARIDAVPSFYRFDALDPVEGTSVVTDVLHGGTTTVHDRAMTESAQVGVIVPMKLLRVGRFVLAAMLGPPILLDLEEVLQALTGGESITKILANEPEVLADLWPIQDALRERKKTPSISNTSGESLVFVTASFGADDVDAALAAIRERSDIRTHEPDDELAWLAGDAEADERTVLGTFQRVGDEIVLSVNSRERMERARRWIEEIPGVRFLQQTERPFDPRDLSIPADDRMVRGTEDPPAPELLAAIRSAVHDHSMRWLDEPVPALAGRTPRAVAVDPEGRERVARMIRSMPPAGGPGGISIDPPREEMLRELGLE